MIARAVRLARASSSTVSIVTLIGFNLIPLGGVLFWGWNVATLLVLYWVENGIVGLLNVPKILLAEGQDTLSVDIVDAGEVSLVSKAGQVTFFLVHYGLFWFVHGIFVFILPSLTMLGGSGLPAGPTFDPSPFGLGPTGFPIAADHIAIRPDFRSVAVGAVGLAISHGASFVVNYLGRREYLKVTPARQMFAPYSRLVVLHLTILFGAFLGIVLGSPVGLLIVLVLLKIALDLGLHIREHGGLTAERNQT
ncbi:MAG: hypothetical protein H0V73_03820 [Chloroflexi bacterium]|nr:hypothetical protein [Chloroflexota bacterium]